MKKLFIAAMLLLSMATLTEAQVRKIPPGKWWRDSRIAWKVQLTREQQQRLDEIFNTASANLVDGKAEIKKLEIALRAELDRPELRRPEIDRIVSQLSAARARLFDRELMMLVEMRSALHSNQWELLQGDIKGLFRPPHRPRPRPL